MKLWFWKRKQDQELDEEIQAHLAMAKRDRVDSGESSNEATENVRREFGNPTLIKEVTREMWGWSSVERFWKDISYGFRSFVQTPVFTLTAVLSLGLGIGANTTIFTLISTIFLNPVPVERPSTLAAIEAADSTGKNRLAISRMNWEDIRSRNNVFSDVAAFSSPHVAGLAKEQTARPERLFIELVSANYFDVLGLHPLLGRFFIPEEDRTPGTHPVVVLAFPVWQQRFGAAPNIVGQTARINGVPFTVIGVAPQGFKGVNAVFGPDAWIPSMMAEQIQPAQMKDWLKSRSAAVFRLAGRLKPNVAVEQANANMKTIGSALEKDFPEAYKDRILEARPINEAGFAPGERQFALFGTFMLMAIAGLVLLIACSNVANLLLARAATRRHEMAVRMALGAGRMRLIRQLLTESALLAFMSGLCGLGFAYLSTRLISAYRPADVVNNLTEPKFDPAVFLFAFAVSVFTGLLFGLTPALESSRPQLTEALQEGRIAGRNRRISMRNTLLVGQVAFSLVALITATLFLRSIERAYAIDPGFETKRLGIILLDPAQAGYKQPRIEQYYRDIRARANSVPGVVGTALSSNLPLFGRVSRGISVEGDANTDRAKNATTILNTVQPEYFSTMGVKLVSGRDFAEADQQNTLPVAIVNEATAATYWPNGNAIGHRIQLSGEKAQRVIIGVVRNANYQSLGEAPRTCVYVPFTQNFSSAMVLYIRTQGDPSPVLATIQRELRAMDSQVPVDDARTAAKVIDQSLWTAKLAVGLLSVFGLLGLALASIGLYGVTSYSVSQRQREIGVRMALGANQGAVMKLILTEMMQLILIGIAIGIFASFLVRNLLSGFLFGVGALDPLSLTGASLLLIIVVLIACYLPAWRASRVDPMLVLRQT